MIKENNHKEYDGRARMFLGALRDFWDEIHPNIEKLEDKEAAFEPMFYRHTSYKSGGPCRILCFFLGKNRSRFSWRAFVKVSLKVMEKHRDAIFKVCGGGRRAINNTNFDVKKYEKAIEKVREEIADEFNQLNCSSDDKMEEYTTDAIREWVKSNSFSDVIQDMYYYHNWG
jgi:hypothetical protein